MPVDVAAKVEHQTVLLGRMHAKAPPADLREQARRLGRPQDRDAIDVRRVVTRRQHVDIDQPPQPTRLEVVEQGCPLQVQRAARHHAAPLAGPVRDLLGHVRRVIDASGEYQDRPPPARLGNDLGDRRLRHLVDVEQLLDFAGDELAAANVQPRRIDLSRRRYAGQVAQVARVNQRLDADVVGDPLK